MSRDRGLRGEPQPGAVRRLASALRRSTGRPARDLWLLLAPFLAENLQARQENIEFVHISTNQDLSDGTVQALAQNHAGFLWADAKDGLDQDVDDGFVHFRHGVGPSPPPDNHVFALLVDSRSELWTLRGGPRGAVCDSEPAAGRIRTRGSTWVESEGSGQGSTMCFTLPQKG